MAIRVASIKDVAEIASTHVISWHETYAGMVPEAMLSSLSVDGRTAMWRQIIGAPVTSGSSNVYVAEVDSTIVGLGLAVRSARRR
jgi:hypothetical protein